MIRLNGKSGRFNGLIAGQPKKGPPEGLQGMWPKTHVRIEEEKQSTARNCRTLVKSPWLAEPGRGAAPPLKRLASTLGWQSRQCGPRTGRPPL